jgi:nuclear transcription Y subunit beta
MNGEDLIFAMQNLGFDNYIEPLKIFLQKYRDTTKTTGERSGDEQSNQNDDAASFNKYLNGNAF